MQDDFANLTEIFQERFSCRAYLNREVDMQTVNEMVAAASRVPTWCNAQPWKLLVTGREATARLAEKLVKAAETTAMAPDLAWPLAYVSRRGRVFGRGAVDNLNGKKAWRLSNLTFNDLRVRRELGIT